MDFVKNLDENLDQEYRKHLLQVNKKKQGERGSTWSSFKIQIKLQWTTTH